ncbi:hypothetical protein TGARI_233157 [Toxoplasma gondii ARI]|uniref:Uncharacterized protein n=1 Tax=Toxoplasma gondii ARI TaxID=1074872 RepID=A0A139Y589_TOXGO|nr:hypothetical protein TGARI_233157 [Toxoplasma gondii ARI]
MNGLQRRTQRSGLETPHCDSQQSKCSGGLACLFAPSFSFHRREKTREAMCTTPSCPVLPRPSQLLHARHRDEHKRNGRGRQERNAKSPKLKAVFLTHESRCVLRAVATCQKQSASALSLATRTALVLLTERRVRVYKHLTRKKRDAHRSIQRAPTKGIFRGARQKYTDGEWRASLFWRQDKDVEVALCVLSAVRGFRVAARKVQRTDGRDTRLWHGRRKQLLGKIPPGRWREAR